MISFHKRIFSNVSSLHVSTAVAIFHVSEFNGSVLTLSEMNTQSDHEHDGHSIIVGNVKIRHWSFNQNLIVEKR
jgi:hypothetical protein